jgi:D-alanine transaminase
MESLACLNGELLPVDEARVPVMDRGFLFGDAVYEVIRIYEGRCWLEDEHLGRLERSLAALEFGPVDISRLTDRLRRVISASAIGEGTAYIHLTRGVASREHAFPRPGVPLTELIIVRAFDAGRLNSLRDTGVKTLSHPDLRWKRCDVKSTNLLGNVLASEAARRAGCYEAILVDSEGFVTEATHSSVIWAREGRLEGTPEGPGILPGTTRRLLLHLAREIGLPFTPAVVKLEELVRADEVMLVGTTTEVLAVSNIDEHPISGGCPGPIAKRLQDAYRSTVERWLKSPIG